MVRHSEAVRQVRHFSTQHRKRAKLLIYIVIGYIFGIIESCLTCLTASPREGGRDLVPMAAFLCRAETDCHPRNSHTRRAAHG